MADPSDNASKRRPGSTNMARKLRRNQTEAEHRLWSLVRNRLLNGYKFSRQIPLGPYIFDFLCRDHKLVIELDGSQHAGSVADDVRTHWLNAQGYAVLRFWNHEILQHPDAVLDTILAALNGALSKRCDATRFFPRTIDTSRQAARTAEQET